MVGNERLKVPQGEFELTRYPAHTNGALRAWDAADEFLLRHLAGIGEVPDVKGRILIVNDYAGALSTTLASHHPMMLSDSYLAHVATRNNLARNGIDVSAVLQLASFDPLPSSINVVVMKIPKSLALLEDQLHRMAPHIHEKTLLFCRRNDQTHSHFDTQAVYKHRWANTIIACREKGSTHLLQPRSCS